MKSNDSQINETSFYKTSDRWIGISYDKMMKSVDKNDKNDKNVKVLVKRKEVKVPSQKIKKNSQKMVQAKIINERSRINLKIDYDEQKTSPDRSLDMNKSKVNRILNALDENVKLPGNTDHLETIKAANCSNVKVKNAFELLMVRKGDTLVKTPKVKVKRCAKNGKLALKDTYMKLDSWLDNSKK